MHVIRSQFKDGNPRHCSSTKQQPGRIGGGSAAPQCGKAPPYRKHSNFDRGSAARCTVVALPTGIGVLHHSGLCPLISTGKAAPLGIERYREAQSSFHTSGGEAATPG
jgi:hypothetical protein